MSVGKRPFYQNQGTYFTQFFWKEKGQKTVIQFISSLLKQKKEKSKNVLSKNQRMILQNLDICDRIKLKSKINASGLDVALFHHPPVFDNPNGFKMLRMTLK